MALMVTDQEECIRRLRRFKISLRKAGMQEKSFYEETMKPGVEDKFLALSSLKKSAESAKSVDVFFLLSSATFLNFIASVIIREIRGQSLSFAQAVQPFLAFVVFVCGEAHVDLVAAEGWRRQDFVAELVFADELEFVG